MALPRPRRLALAFVLFLLSTSAGAQQVTLSLERFQQLWDAAHPKPPKPPDPALPVALEWARVEIQVGADAARVRTRLGVRVFAGGWQRLPLGDLPAVLGHRVEQGTAEVRLVTTPAPPSLEVRGLGFHLIELSQALPISTDRTAVEVERRLVVPLPNAAMVTGRLELADGTPPASLRLEGPASVPIQAEGPGRWSFVGAPGSRLPLRWFGTSVTAPPPERGPLVFDATTASALVVSRARLRLTSWLLLQVRSGALVNVEIPLPPGYEVLAVTGPEVASWDLGEGLLRVSIRPPGSGVALVETQLSADPAVEFGVPLLSPRGARSVRSALKVTVGGGDGYLEPMTPEAIEVLPPDQLAQDSAGSPAVFPPGYLAAPGEAQRPVAGAPSPAWRVTWATGGDVLTGQVDRLVVDALVGETGAVLYRLWAAVRTGDSGLAFTLPPGARLLTAERNGQGVTPGQAGEDWVVPMVVRKETQVVYLETRVDLPFPAAGGRWSLPLVKLGAPASVVEVRVVLPPGFRYKFAEPGRAGAVGPPPRLEATSMELAARVPSPATLYPAPPGFPVIEARWSGFTNDPPPLLLDVEPVTTKAREEGR